MNIVLVKRRPAVDASLMSLGGVQTVRLDRNTEFPYTLRVAADELQFEWDDAKAEANLRKHGVSFEAAAAIFDDPDRLEEDDAYAQGEYRLITVGAVDGFILAVVYAESEENLVRLISARLATARERKAYEQNLFHP